MEIYYKFNAQMKKYIVQPAGLELIEKYNGVSKISNFSSKKRVLWFEDAFFTTVDRRTVLYYSSEYPKNVVEYCNDPKNARVFTVWYFDINKVMRMGCNSANKCFKNLNKKEIKNRPRIHL